MRLRALGLRSGPLGPLDIQLEQGECLGLSGPSGSGKSLLLRALADLDTHGGEVWLNNQPQHEIDPPGWRRQVTWVAAESAWWADHVGAHFTHIDTAQWHALGFAPETRDWEIRRLSTGEKQRLALLRGLQSTPSVLLLDEPSSALDASNTLRVETLVADYRHATGAAVIWVSHDPEQLARVSDRQLHLLPTDRATGD